MKYLFDTHAMLWVVQDDESLTAKVKKIYLGINNDIYFSAASVWEMAIKVSLKKLKLPQKLSSFVKDHISGNDVQILQVSTEHLYPLENLPHHHRDPFDRLIVSQCIKEKMPLISKDKVFDKYGVKRIW